MFLLFDPLQPAGVSSGNGCQRNEAEFQTFCPLPASGGDGLPARLFAGRRLPSVPGGVRRLAGRYPRGLAGRRAGAPDRDFASPAQTAGADGGRHPASTPARHRLKGLLSSGHHGFRPAGGPRGFVRPQPRLRESSRGTQGAICSTPLHSRRRARTFLPSLSAGIHPACILRFNRSSPGFIARVARDGAPRVIFARQRRPSG